MRIMLLCSDYPPGNRPTKNTTPFKMISPFAPVHRRQPDEAGLFFYRVVQAQALIKITPRQFAALCAAVQLLCKKLRQGFGVCLAYGVCLAEYLYSRRKFDSGNVQLCLFSEVPMNISNRMVADYYGALVPGLKATRFVGMNHAGQAFEACFLSIA